MSHDGAPPTVSAVVPTRDRWPLLSRALASVFAQEAVELEAVVVDDGSTDETPGQLRLLAAREPRLRPILLPAQGGVAAARNRGIAESRGRWVAFLDDDDVWAPTKLRQQVAAASDDVSLVYTTVLLLDDDFRVTSVRFTPAPSVLPTALFDSNVIGGPSSVMAPTDLLREVGGFDERLSVLADWDLWVRLLEGGRAAACFEPLTGYCVHAGSMHRVDLRHIRAELRYLRAKHRRICTTLGVEFGGETFMEWLTEAYRREGRRLDASRGYARAGIRERSLSDLLRAGGMLLGERAMRAASRRRPGPKADPPPEPGWLAPLRSHPPDPE
jgi:glycosyltransferase involved in cell wall biosynthesis